MPSKRVLVTGLSTYWGGRLAKALEADQGIEAIIGVDNEEPHVELERTEYVKVGAQHALLRRVVEAADVDTVIDTRLVVDSATTTPGRAHENNIIGTMNILAASSGARSPVRKLVFKSSAQYYGCEQDDPAFFEETMGRPHPPRTPIERDIVEAEAAVREFAEKNDGVSVTILRFANVLGPSVRTSHIQLFSLPAVPMILGFDPRYQFVHEDDVVHALEHVVKHSLPGTYNVAGDGVLALSEVAGLLGKPYLPILPPWGTGLAASALRRLGLNIPPEMLNQLRFGRGIDNRRLKATGFRYGYTSRETVLQLAEHLRLDPLLRGTREPYRYEREVEEFLRWSPHAKTSRLRGAPGLSRGQLADLQRLLSAYAEAEGIGAVEELVADGGPASEPGSVPTGERGRGPVGADVTEPPRPEQPEAPVGEAPGEREAAAPRPSPVAPPERQDEPPPGIAEPPVEHYDDLEPEEVISLLRSLDREGLLALRDYEREHRARSPVIGAIDSVLARRPERARG